MSSETHVTGESIFVDDIAPMQGEVFVSYVGSPVPAGELQSVDASSALKLPGVLAVYTARDFHQNLWGTIVQDQPIVVEKEIGYRDEPLCVVVADNKTVLEEARKLVKFKIKSKPAILHLNQAIEQKSYLHTPTPFECGDVDAAFKKAPHILRGEIEIGGQEHFYLESQASIVYPDDHARLKIISSSQHPTETQHLVAHAVGLPFHHVVCEVKRMGGAFGGKESQAAPFAAMAALAAHKLKRPARIVLSKDDDMRVTGKRHPFKNFFEVAFDDDGRILGLKAKLYADGGAYTDLSPSILDRAMFHIDGSYFIENGKIEGWVCKTNTHSNTAFRGFGGPQGNMTIETIIEDIARVLKKDAAEIRLLNCYGKNDRNQTHYGQTVENNLLPELFQRALSDSNYREQRKEIDRYNAQTVKQARGQVKGLAVTACKFGISFTARFLNQGNALVNVHRDGTIQISTGATEMGQGVNLKIARIAADAFGIPIEDVQVMTTSTEKNANTSPTAASSGSDINGAATLIACEQIIERLRYVAAFHFSGRKLTPEQEFEIPQTTDQRERTWLERIRFQNQSVTDGQNSVALVDLINLAYQNRISLSAYGHYKTDGLAFDRAKGKGRAFRYFTPGVAVSEVLIDTYTGDTKILRSDIVMDLGRMIDEGVDRGQVSGGFVQGAGWLTTENLYYAKDGALLSHSPTTYKIPNVQDMPRIFNISFIENDLNVETVRRSKAVGEPPLLLGASVFMAIKNALSYRKPGNRAIQLNAPATPEVILKELYEF